MKPFLKAKVHTDDNDELHYGLEVSNGSSSTEQGFYGHKEDWTEFAAGLRDFPATIHDEIRFEIGEDTQKCAYYILLKAFCFDSVGHSALEVHISSPISAPHGHRDHFFIRTDPAALNRLGELLSSWSKDEKTEILWNP